MKEELHETTSSEQSTKFNELFRYILVAKGTEKLENTKGVTRSRKSKDNIMDKRKRTNNGL